MMNDENKNIEELPIDNDYKNQFNLLQEQYQQLLDMHTKLESRFKKYVDQETQSKVSEEQKYESIEDKRRKLEQEMEKLK